MSFQRDSGSHPADSTASTEYDSTLLYLKILFVCENEFAKSSKVYSSHYD